MVWKASVNIPILFPPLTLFTIEIHSSWHEFKRTIAHILYKLLNYKLFTAAFQSSQGVIVSYLSFNHASVVKYLPILNPQVGCPLSFCPLVDAALYCLSVWVNNNCLMNWATLTTWASPPLSLAVRCGCGLLQSVEILSVCTANQRSACSRDVVLLSRQPPTFLSQFWSSSLVSAPCLFISLSPFCMCFYQRCCPSAVL